MGLQMKNNFKTAIFILKKSGIEKNIKNNFFSKMSKKQIIVQMLKSQRPKN